MTALSRWRYRMAASLGRILAETELNSFQKIHIDQQNHYAKRRRWYSRLAIAAGNPYLRWLGVRTQVLPADVWYAWESRVFQILYGRRLTTSENGWLLIPELPGITLATLIQSPEITDPQKLNAIRLAVESLRQIHNVAVEWPDGEIRPFSHSDATVENVIIHESTATWIDFDMVHDGSMHANWRHADDLRALTYSAAKHLRPATFPDLATIIAETYAHSPVLNEFAKTIAQWRNFPNSFHLAQAQLGYEHRQMLDAALLRALGVV